MGDVQGQAEPFSPAAAEPRPLSGAPIMSPGPSEPQAAAPVPATSETPQSPAFVRFGSCRWQQPAEEGNAAFCTHREVKPYAGMQGFDADAWCGDCQYYKLRRAPKKRTPGDEYTY
jgi:hypothetical protein